MNSIQRAACGAILAAGLVLGCGGGEETPAKKTPVRLEKSEAKEESTASSTPGNAKRKFLPVDLAHDAAEAGGVPDTKAKLSDEQKAQAIVAALQPFQVLLGDWRWGTRKQFGDFAKTGEDLKWVWDFRSNPDRPALKGTSDDNPYFQKLWLTWLPDEETFQMTGKSPDGEAYVLRGTWTENGEPREESDGKKTQHSYKLQLTQVSPAAGEQWQATLNQLDNNQYLLVLARSPAAGKAFAQLDTVRQQRVGTSFAVADSDNPGPKCIISGGLGTIQVEYKGKSYFVCCSGCAAAFKDEPERWLAKLAEKERAKKTEE